MVWLMLVVGLLMVPYVYQYVRMVLSIRRRSAVVRKAEMVRLKYRRYQIIGAWLDR